MELIPPVAEKLMAEVLGSKVVVSVSQACLFETCLSGSGFCLLACSFFRDFDGDR